VLSGATILGGTLAGSLAKNQNVGLASALAIVVLPAVLARGKEIELPAGSAVDVTFGAPAAPPLKTN
jgi:hypothetical protein